MIHFGLMHTFRKYTDVRKMIDRLKQDQEQVGGDPHLLSKIENELKVLKSFRMTYELVICDPYLAKSIDRFFTVHMKLMR